MSNGITVAVIGATGLVGQTMLHVLQERALPVGEVIPVASERSRGRDIPFRGQSFTATTLEDGQWRRANAALLSAGGSVSRQWSPVLAETGVVCIDNSSAFRFDEAVPLVVPEVNANAIDDEHFIIANPNCSTIQLVVALQPLHKAFGLTEVVVATYQSASGAGQTGKDALLHEMDGKKVKSSPFPHRLAHNLIPIVGNADQDDPCFEEWKMIQETRKILGIPDLPVFPATVRVPVAHCHGEAVHLKFERQLTAGQAREILNQAPGIQVIDSPQDDRYPTPLECSGKDEVFVGRIRQVEGVADALDFWIVSDNLRKGAATNAVQILEVLLAKGRFESVI